MCLWLGLYYLQNIYFWILLSKCCFANFVLSVNFSTGLLMAISTDPKPEIYRNLYENMGPDTQNKIRRSPPILHSACI